MNVNVGRQTGILELDWTIATGLLVLSSPVTAQTMSLHLGDRASATGWIDQIITLIKLLPLAPSILVMVTSFTRIIVALSLTECAWCSANTAECSPY